MSKCKHSLAEQETACADGMCPLCLAKDIIKFNDKCVEMRRRAKELLRDTKLLGLVFETYRDKTPPAVKQAIKGTFENINQALAALEPSQEQPYVIYQASNKVSTMFFASRDDAEEYAGNAGAAAGIQIFETFVMPKSIKPCQKCGGSGRVPTLRSVGFGQENQIMEPCPACSELEPQSGEFVKYTRGKLLDPYIYCQMKNPPMKPLEDLRKALDIINEQADQIAELMASRELARKTRDKTIKVMQRQAEHLAEVEAECKNWRRVCEKIEGEKKQLTEQIEKLKKGD